ncbi:hypothetical protein J4474_03365 [Candidatus Pacearchaeota archaeon]|nr:hypothetical protein [Candidatus Pacearchaeota archaeon]
MKKTKKNSKKEIPKKTEKQFKESDLEEKIIKEIKEIKEEKRETKIRPIENFEINELFDDVKISGAPVLEKIAESQEQAIRFERGVKSSPVSLNSDDEPLKYTSGIEKKGEPKYVSSSEILNSPQQGDTLNLGRTREPSFQEIGFRESSEARTESQMVERYAPVERADVEKAGRERASPFEEKDLRKKMGYEIK